MGLTWLCSTNDGIPAAGLPYVTKSTENTTSDWTTHHWYGRNTLTAPVATACAFPSYITQIDANPDACYQLHLRRFGIPSGLLLGLSAVLAVSGIQVWLLSSHFTTAKESQLNRHLRYRL